MKPTITLCMIVKNETHVILRCLESVYKYIDRYDITDTGSTDGTQDMIRKFFAEKNIPGEIYQSDWKGFGDHAGKIGSRTEAFQNAKGKADYAWVIDADDSLSGDLILPEGTDVDAYTLQFSRGEFSWWRTQIFKNNRDWRYVGVLHEYPDSDPKPYRIEKLNGNYFIEARTEGARNIGVSAIEKYSKDAEALEKAIVEDPTNVRYQFYLAQSYFDSQQWEKAIGAYKRRAEMGGWEEEVFFSLYRVAICKVFLQHPWSEIYDAFMMSYESRPTRAEPLYQLARLHRMHNRPKAAYVYARMALEIPRPVEDTLFIEEIPYAWGNLDELGAVAHTVGKFHLGMQVCHKLLCENKFPPEHKQRIENNFNSYKQIVSKIQHERGVAEMIEKQKEKEIKKINKKKHKVKQ
jgi:glycosyltransferase involved in cell wall biosynthesis